MMFRAKSRMPQLLWSRNLVQSVETPKWNTIPCNCDRLMKVKQSSIPVPSAHTRPNSTVRHVLRIWKQEQDTTVYTHHLLICIKNKKCLNNGQTCSTCKWKEGEGGWSLLFLSFLFLDKLRVLVR